jgi:hypothetical protein
VSLSQLDLDLAGVASWLDDIRGEITLTNHLVSIRQNNSQVHRELSMPGGGIFANQHSDKRNHQHSNERNHLHSNDERNHLHSDERNHLHSNKHFLGDLGFKAQMGCPSGASGDRSGSIAGTATIALTSTATTTTATSISRHSRNTRYFSFKCDQLSFSCDRAGQGRQLASAAASRETTCPSSSI